MADYTVTLTDSEDKAMQYVVVSVQEWVNNVVHDRARVAKDTIYNEEVQRMTDDPDISSIPADKDQVVLDADLETAKERAEAEVEVMENA